MIIFIEIFVRERHFGGGPSSKPEGTEQSRKEWIDNIIAESKKKKEENKKEKEIQNEEVDKLDEQFQSFLSLMKGKKMTW